MTISTILLGARILRAYAMVVSDLPFGLKLLSSGLLHGYCCDFPGEEPLLAILDFSVSSTKPLAPSCIISP